MSEHHQLCISCPKCKKPHVDVNEWAERPHHKHLCHHCHHVWRLDEYVFGSGAYRDMGFQIRFAEGFDSGCRYSDKRIAALEADNAKLREALKTALETNGYSQQGIATLIGRLSEKETQ